MKIFHDDFRSIKDIISQFDIPLSEVNDIEIIYAAYNYKDYQGYAFVVFVKNNTLYEVNGSHCSCNGLEGCWEPEETDVAALLSRPDVPIEAKNNLKERYKNYMAFL